MPQCARCQTDSIPVIMASIQSEVDIKAVITTNNEQIKIEQKDNFKIGIDATKPMCKECWQLFKRFEDLFPFRLWIKSQHISDDSLDNIVG